MRKKRGALAKLRASDRSIVKRTIRGVSDDAQGGDPGGGHPRLWRKTLPQCHSAARLKHRLSTNEGDPGRTRADEGERGATRRDEEGRGETRRDEKGRPGTMGDEEGRRGSELTIINEDT